LFVVVRVENGQSSKMRRTKTAEFGSGVADAVAAANTAPAIARDAKVFFMMAQLLDDVEREG
jgi:hypothetical protein